MLTVLKLPQQKAKRMHILLTFYTQFDALQAYKNAQEIAGITNVKMIAVPRKISSTCGTAVTFDAPKQVLDNFNFTCRSAFEVLAEDTFTKIK